MASDRTKLCMKFGSIYWQQILARVNQVRNDTGNIPSTLWRSAIFRGHGSGVTQRPSPATRTWWWWWWCGLRNATLGCPFPLPSMENMFRKLMSGETLRAKTATTQITMTLILLY